MNPVLRACLLLAIVPLAACDLELDKALIPGNGATIADAAPDSWTGLDAGKDSSVEAQAGKDSSVEAEAGNHEAGKDAGSDPDASKPDADLEAGCQPEPDAGPCIECAYAQCCGQLTACVADPPCMQGLLEYLSCTGDGGTACLQTFMQGTNDIGIDLVGCVGPKCPDCT